MSRCWTRVAFPPLLVDSCSSVLCSRQRQPINPDEDEDEEDSVGLKPKTKKDMGFCSTQMETPTESD
ncbi:hypothetical protein FH972_000991 [Carpinus fangiana]|uniref:Uncharacterized protein n=1 Tax=Carpinus fangiana TaxID=176857 RepID=A0A5N6QAJ8_9ROSI|nr:hypothetical protein FH972_000991 [Carpinus fangiana]